MDQMKIRYWNIRKHGLNSKLGPRDQKLVEHSKSRTCPFPHFRKEIENRIFFLCHVSEKRNFCQTGKVACAPLSLSPVPEKRLLVSSVRAHAQILVFHFGTEWNTAQSREVGQKEGEQEREEHSRVSRGQGYTRPYSSFFFASLSPFLYIYIPVPNNFFPPLCPRGRT